MQVNAVLVAYAQFIIQRESERERVRERGSETTLIRYLTNMLTENVSVVHGAFLSDGGYTVIS